MTSNDIALAHDIQVTRDIGSFAVTWVDRRSGHPLTVELRVVTDELQRYTLEVGDTFPVRNETWKLARFDDDPDDKWLVLLTRVDA